MVRRASPCGLLGCGRQRELEGAGLAAGWWLRACARVCVDAEVTPVTGWSQWASARAHTCRLARRATARRRRGERGEVSATREMWAAARRKSVASAARRSERNLLRGL